MELKGLNRRETHSLDTKRCLRVETRKRAAGQLQVGMQRRGIDFYDEIYRLLLDLLLLDSLSVLQ